MFSYSMASLMIRRALHKIGEIEVKKLGGHFALSMIHADMFVQGLLWLCSFSTNFTAVLKSVGKMYGFYVIEHICFQGIYVATDSALE